MTDTTDPDVADHEPSGVPGLPANWPQQATTRLVDVVDTVRIKTSGPAIRVSRAVVYGLVGLVLALVATPLLLVGLTRLLDYAIPGDIWRVYLLVGAVFTLVGLVLWSRRPRGAART
jgi:hypothetical protein